MCLDGFSCSVMAEFSLLWLVAGTSLPRHEEATREVDAIGLHDQHDRYFKNKKKVRGLTGFHRLNVSATKKIKFQFLVSVLFRVKALDMNRYRVERVSKKDQCVNVFNEAVHTHCHPVRPGKAAHTWSKRYRRWRSCPLLHSEATGNQPEAQTRNSESVFQV